MPRRAVFLLALLPALVAAQPTPSDPIDVTGTDKLFVIPHLDGSITLDRRVDEAAWDAVAPLPLVTHYHLLRPVTTTLSCPLFLVAAGMLITLNAWW